MTCQQLVHSSRCGSEERARGSSLKTSSFFEARRRSAERVRIFESSRNREEGLMRGCHAIEKLEIDILERWEMEKCNAEERI
jgi:hypothetical protein